MNATKNAKVECQLEQYITRMSSSGSPEKEQCFTRTSSFASPEKQALASKPGFELPTPGVPPLTAVDAPTAEAVLAVLRSLSFEPSTPKGTAPIEPLTPKVVSRQPSVEPVSPKSPRTPKTPKQLWNLLRQGAHDWRHQLPRVHVDCKFASTSADCQGVLSWTEGAHKEGDHCWDGGHLDSPRTPFDHNYWEAEVKKMSGKERRPSRWTFNLVRRAIAGKKQ